MPTYEPFLYESLTMLEILACQHPFTALFDQAGDVRRINAMIQFPLPTSEPADEARLWFVRTASELNTHRMQVSGGSRKASPDNYTGPASEMYLQEAGAANKRADELVQFLTRHAGLCSQLVAHRKDAINHQLTLIGTARKIGACYQAYARSVEPDPNRLADEIAGYLTAANGTMLLLEEAINLTVRDVGLMVEDTPPTETLA